MLTKRLYNKGKYLALLLRHKPEKEGLKPDSGGWVPVIEILSALDLTSKELDQIVALNDKKRFAYNTDYTMIRASQGHSIKVDLGLEAKEPPELLYHGTIKQYLNVILVSGIKKINRHAVHLSVDIDTAKKVGNRHAKKVGNKHGITYVLFIRAKDMHKDNYSFYLSENGVWLTDHIPPEYINYVLRPPGE